MGWTQLICFIVFLIFILLHSYVLLWASFSFSQCEKKKRIINKGCYTTLLFQLNKYLLYVAKNNSNQYMFRSKEHTVNLFQKRKREKNWSYYQCPNHLKCTCHHEFPECVKLMAVEIYSIQNRHWFGPNSSNVVVM